MQAGVGLLASDMMPIYMIIPRYSHNYAQFYQLLAVIRSPTIILMLLREATSETYGPRVYLLSYLLSIYIYLHLYFLHLYYKIPKIYLSYLIISIRSHFRKWPWRDWQPLYCVGCEDFICLSRCEGLVRGLLLDWYLGSQKLREILTLLYCITLSSSRENQRSAQEVARRISGAVAGEVYAKVNILSTHHNLLSPALHYLPFASRFPLPHFTLAILFTLLFRSPLFRLFLVCSCVGLLVCRDGST